MKINAILFLIVGTLLIWLGLNGKLGVFLASLFTPNLVKMREDEGTEEEVETVSESFSPVSQISSTPILPSGISRLQG